MTREWKRSETGSEILLAPRWMPIAGWLVGGASAGAFALMFQVAPKPIALVSALITGIIFSGALHERGFASLCDGFGGGWTRDDVLRILSDARIGSYGVTGLVLLLLLEFQLLAAGGAAMLPWLIFAAHALGRFAMVPIMGMTAPIAWSSQPRPTMVDLALAFVPGVIPLLILGAHLPFMLAALPMGALIIYFALRRFRARTGGYTGPGLSAVQKAVQTSVYIIALIAPRFPPAQDILPWKFF